MKQRHQVKKLLKEQGEKKISVLIGPRQVGKSTILKALHKQLGGIFIDLDIFSNYNKVSTYENFISTLKLNNYDPKQTNFFYIFLDEFQKYKHLGNVMKNIYDNHNNIKIYASGSSSLEIRDNIQESLAGRKIITYIYPLSFIEFLEFKSEDQLINQLKNIDNLETSNYIKLIPQLYPYLEEFLIYGGYPEVVTSKRTDKKQILENIFDLFIKKDLADFANIDILYKIKTLIQKLAINNGCLTNYSNLAAVTNLDNKTIKKYIYLLQETYIINILNPFFNNKNKEINKAPKIYFMDNGVANYFYNNFNSLNIRNDGGTLFEGFILSELMKSGHKRENIKFYKTKNGHEVDIVLQKENRNIPIEIKFSENIKTSDTRHLYYFLNEYKEEYGYLISLSFLKTEKNIKYISFFHDF